ncbi:retrovirus-related pol polyprotein from transposon TNT 1-94 [Tanacetum coccineum]
MSINHEKYTLVIVDEYSKYTWVNFLKKKSQEAEMIMSFVRMVESQNHVKVKQIRTDNGTEFRNSELESFCNEKEISQNFYSPYTPEENSHSELHVTLIIDQSLSKDITRLPMRYLEKESMISATFMCLDAKDHLSKFDAKADNGYFLGYSFVSKAFREDDPSRQYQSNSDYSYYIIPHGRSLTELTQKNRVPKVITPNKQNTPQTEDVGGPPDLINTEGT